MELLETFLNTWRGVEIGEGYDAKACAKESDGSRSAGTDLSKVASTPNSEIDCERDAESNKNYG